METLLQDLRFAARSLLKSPGFSAVAVLTLALGIGTTAAMFSLLRGALWRPPPVAHPEQLVVVFAQHRADKSYTDFSWADYIDFREARDVFQGLIAYYPQAMSLSRAGVNEHVWGEVVSGNYFSVLGVSATLGRALTPDDDTAAAPVAVISERFWRRRLQSDPQLVGGTLKLSGQAFTVVGVMPGRFEGVYFVGFQPDLWVPASALERVAPGSRGRLADRGSNSFRLMGRLRPGVGVKRAQAVVGAIAARLEKDHPRTNTGYAAVAFRERDSRPEPDGAQGAGLAAVVFMCGVGLVLLISCANVAGLLLARGTSRRAELGVRVSLGADRWSLVRQLLTEAALLALLGGLIGAGLAYLGTDVLSSRLQLPTDIPFAFDFRLDEWGLGLTLAVSLLTALACGLFPALQASRHEVVAALKEEGAGGRGTERGRLRDALVVGQLAMSCLLLVCAGLALRSLEAQRRLHPGFDPRNGLLASVSPELQGYPAERGASFYRQLQEAVAAQPGVRSAALARFVPLDFASSGGTLFVDGQASRPDVPAGESVGLTRVTPGYFATMGTPILEGRDLDWRDDGRAHAIVLVNATLAGRHWPGRSAVGQSLRLNAPDAPPLEVVGVVEDGKYRDLSEPPRPHVFVPLTQDYVAEATLVVRTSGEPFATLPAVRQALRSLDPEMPLYDVKSLDQLVAGRTLLVPRLAAGLSGLFSALSLALAMVGLSGVVAYSVACREREIGIRMSLGATPGAVLRLMLRQGALLAAVGCALGLLGAAASTRFLSSLLFGVATGDTLTFALVPLLLVAVALLAAYVPARRAARMDPMTALRSE